MARARAATAELDYKLSSEECPPSSLVRNARRAEEVGFTFALISDHCHPWIDRQGQSPFVRAVLGAVAMTTDRLHVAAGVTCPIIRIHPAIVAQAAATAAAMMQDAGPSGRPLPRGQRAHLHAARPPTADLPRGGR